MSSQIQVFWHRLNLDGSWGCFVPTQRQCRAIRRSEADLL